MEGSFTVNAGALASAVKYVAQWLSAKPIVPVHAGVMFAVDDGRLTVSGFGDNVTARASLSVEGNATGEFVVAGRLVNALLGAVPAKPVTFSQHDSLIAMNAGRFDSTMGAMVVEDYPKLAAGAAKVGSIGGTELADAVKRVAAAASKDLTTRAALAGLHIQFGNEASDGLRLMATDTYRAASLFVDWTPEPHEERPVLGESALVWAAELADAVDAFVGPDDIAIGWEAGTFSLTTPGRELVLREIGGDEFPADGLRRIFASKGTAEATVATHALLDPLKRIDLLRDEKADVVWLRFSDGLAVLRAQAETKGGTEEVDVKYAGDACEIALRSATLRTALATAPGTNVTLSFNPGTVKPIIVTSDGDPSWRFTVVPLTDPNRKTPKGAK